MNDKLQAALEAVDQLAMRLDSSGRSDGVNDLHHAITDALTTQAAVIEYLARQIDEDEDQCEHCMFQCPGTLECGHTREEVFIAAAFKAVEETK